MLPSYCSLRWPPSIWNFIDFQRDGREDVVPNINKKGMVTTDRQPKDVYYLYQSQWNKKPMLYITGKHWKNRIGYVSGNQSLSTELTVFSNLSSLTLYRGKVSLGKKHSSNGIFTWSINLANGDNQFLCSGAGDSVMDMININMQLVDTSANRLAIPATGFHVNTGQSGTFFTDNTTGEIWQPDKPYTPGTWGYEGGNIWNRWPSSAWNAVREGIHKPISKTKNDPLFQTFVEGLHAWRADVAPGKYMVTILLAEPFTDEQRQGEPRVLQIELNNKPWIAELDMAAQAGIQTAFEFKKEISVQPNGSIHIELKALKGKTLLNGVSIQRL